jgi:hypothetical protein
MNYYLDQWNFSWGNAKDVLSLAIKKEERFQSFCREILL